MRSSRIASGRSSTNRTFQDLLFCILEVSYHNRAINLSKRRAANLAAEAESARIAPGEDETVELAEHPAVFRVENAAVELEALACREALPAAFAAVASRVDLEGDIMQKVHLRVVSFELGDDPGGGQCVGELAGGAAEQVGPQPLGPAVKGRMADVMLSREFVPDNIA